MALFSLGKMARETPDLGMHNTLCRTQSTSSTRSNSSMPMTPLGQTTPDTPQHYFTTHQLSSVSSTATSEDEEGTLQNKNQIDSFSDWSGPDDDFLMNTYYAHLNNPTLAPFTGRVPPSGVLQRVAKDTVRCARSKGLLFTHSITATRKRLLLLCNRTSQIQQSRDSPQPSFLVFPDLSHTFRCATPPDMSSSSLSNLNTPQLKSICRLPSPEYLPHDVEGDLLTTSASRKVRDTETRGLSPVHDSKHAGALASPYRDQHELTASRSRSPVLATSRAIVALEETPFPNITSRRKRESLKMKRGMDKRALHDSF